MGNPKRYIFNSHHCRRPVVDMEKKTMTVELYSMGPMGKVCEPFYETARIDFYSAPDVIMTYTNGNTTKDEWCRYEHWVFYNLKLVKEEGDGYEQMKVCEFTFDKCESKWLQYGDDEEEMYVNVPMGKFAGKTLEQVKKYYRMNRIKFKDSPPLSPSEKAIEAAMEVVCITRNEAIKILEAAYAVDWD